MKDLFFLLLAVWVVIFIGCFFSGKESQWPNRAKEAAIASSKMTGWLLVAALAPIIAGLIVHSLFPDADIGAPDPGEADY